MVALEAHEHEGWHYHWAVGGLHKISLSKIKFVSICEKLRDIFGKWSYLAIGKHWAGLEAYYRKNCDGKGDRNGIFVSFPEKASETFVAEQEDRKNHNKLGTKERNLMVISAYQSTGDLM